VNGGAGDLPPSVQTYRERLPRAELGRYVSCVWVQRVAPGSPAHAFRAAPSGSAEIACELGAAAKVVGPQTRPTVGELGPDTTAVGVRFRPGTATALLGLPASELVDVAVDLEDVWGRSAVALAERLAAAQTAEAAAATLELELYDRLAEASPPDAIAAEAARLLHRGGMSDVGWLASSLYISERQLRRRCEAAIGVTPKVLHRILRFQRFLALAHRHDEPSSSLGRLAAEAGYADQAHLSRESLRLAGCSPRALLRESERDCRRAGHDHRVSHAPLLSPDLHRRRAV
jgi:AraC-like DNA-binding protein